MTLDKYKNFIVGPEVVRRTPRRKTGFEDADGKRAYVVITCPYCDAPIFCLKGQLKTRRKCIEQHLGECSEVPDEERVSKRHRGHVKGNLPVQDTIKRLCSDVRALQDALKSMQQAQTQPPTE